MCTKRLCLMAVVGLVFFMAACDGDDDGQSTFVGTGDSLALDCVESGPECTPPNEFSTAVNADTLYSCNYWDSTSILEMEFREGETGKGIFVRINDFTGQGNYVTDPDALTEVVVSTEDIQADSAGVSGSIPEHPCTITASSNLADIQIPENGDAFLLDVDLDISCPSLGSGAVCPISCDIDPTGFSLSVQGCVVSQ